MKEREITITKKFKDRLSKNPWTREMQVNAFCDRVENIAGFHKCTLIPDLEAGIITIIEEED